MAREVIRGAGITQRRLTMFDLTGRTPGDIALWNQSLDRSNAALSRCGGFWGVTSEAARSGCNEILADFADWRKQTFEEDSQEDLAQRVLLLLGYADDHAKRGKFDLAMRDAWDAGRLWEAALTKWRFENEILKARKQADKRRENGRQGGTAARRAEQYKVLSSLAQKKKGFAFASDAQAIRLARALASDYDRGASDHLFQRAGRQLSYAWFADWLAEFRSAMQGDEKNK